jgi:2-polyprenyl-6-methoxyphenol hydroxylase-like FAD-dependent oxidoreductase
MLGDQSHSSQPRSVSRAIIVGGGIGGLCAAIALRQMGMQVTVYEQAGVLAEVGAGITLWPNAIRVLRKLGLAGEVIGAGAKIEHGEYRTAAGQTLTQARPGELEQLYGEPVIGIHRAALHEVLRAALPAETIQLGAMCIGFEQDETGVTVRFEAGRTDQAGLLIGADGIHSLIRRHLFPQVELRYAGYTAWRGVAALAEEVTLGVTFESWGCGLRFGMVRLDEARVYWFATANMPAGRGFTPAESKAFLRQRFKGWHRPIERLIEATPAEAILHNDIYDFKPIPDWSRGRVTLLGDAAHATTPNMGQGACMAIESSLVLARCLVRESNLAAALNRYEAERRPRTAEITNQSWQIGRIGQLENRLGCAVRNFVIRVTPDSVMKKRLEKVVGYEV